MIKAKKLRKGALAIEGASHVRRTTFGGLPIVDAKADFTLIVRTKDVVAAKGHEKDAANCILAKACAQQVGASIVAFFKMTAYLELPDAKGRKRVVRYLLDRDAAAIVAAFDRGESVKGEVMVTLRAPSKSHQLDYIRDRTKASKERKRNAILNGVICEHTNRNRRLFTKPRIAEMDVRNGSGLVHNTVKKAKG